MSPVRLAVTLGDPRGIGPEVMVQAARLLCSEGEASSPPVPSSRGGPPTLHFLGPGALLPGDFDGEAVEGWDGTEAGAGKASFEALRRGVELCLAGRADGLVTGPVHKPALTRAGHPAPGQTELLRELTGAPAVGMLMAAEETRVGAPLRILLATTHLPLREVPRRLTAELLVEQTVLLTDALRREWGLETPRVALCALNPHASDGGLFGDEEARIYAPALETLRGRGLDVAGPLPADTVFRRALEGRFHGVVAPYHDVGMAAFKTVSFGRGVNVTLGLPFVRTSPDHGTAFDLVGTGGADPGSALEAARLAARLAAARGAARDAGGPDGEGFDAPPDRK